MRHRYGGFYEFSTLAIDTSNGESVAVYRHLWPFEGTWFTRPSVEFFDGRFRQATQEELDSFKQKGEAACQAYVAELKGLKKSYWDQS